jgi:hypothetical protein
MFSRRSLEGFLEINHAASPGTALVPEGTVLERATYTCSHCQGVVIINPERTRERERCATCDRYICDTCGAAKKAGAPCETFIQRAERLIKGASL